MKIISIVALTSVFFGLAYSRMAYEFAAGYQDIIGEPNRSFSCEGRSYGYYADADNDCKIFHVCNPIANELGEVSFEKFKFSNLAGLRK